MLPANFWKEFDSRLDAKLDAKFAEFEERMDARIVPIENKLNKLNDKVNRLITWTQRQDASIERELTDAVRNHLQAKYKTFLTIAPTAFPKRIKYRDLEVTEFDGIMILTNYPELVTPKQT